MKILNLKSWKTAFLLSIVVPMGLLTSFKLIGLINEPPIITENIKLEMIEWEFPRINGTRDVYLKDVLEARYDNDGLSAVFLLKMGEYFPQGLGGFRDEEVGMIANITFNMTNADAFIWGLQITFQENQTLSRVDFWSQEIVIHNLSLTDLYYGMRKSDVKAYLSAIGSKNSVGGFLSVIAIWKLFSPHDYTHLMKVTIEIIYYNGTVYKKIIQPFQLCLRPDLQYIKIYTGSLNVTNGIVFGHIDLTGIKVLIDNIEYLSPVSVVLKAGTHRIEFESVVYVNSTKYVLVGVVINSEKVVNGPIAVIGAENYSCLSATYEREGVAGIK